MGQFRYFAACIVGVAVALVVGMIPLVLPYPAINEEVVSVPPHLLPVRPSPLVDDFAPNTKLEETELFLKNEIQGPETVILDDDGKTIFLLDKFGYVFKGAIMERPNGVLSVQLDKHAYAYLGPGRPLGAELDKDGNLIICDSLKGLIMLEKYSKRVVILANRVWARSDIDAGSEISYANDLAIAHNGTIYFSSSTDIRVAINSEGFYDTVRGCKLDFFRGKPTGKLLAYYPESREAHVLASGLWFANGVALAKDESFVAVAETSTLSVQRYWLKGPKVGQTDILIDQLPGFPDGVSLAEDGNFFVALVAGPSPALKILQYPVLRFLCAWLVKFLPGHWLIPPWGGVVKVDADGRVLESYFDVDGKIINSISSVREHRGRLYLGNVRNDYIGVVEPSRDK